MKTALVLMVPAVAGCLSLFPPRANARPTSRSVIAVHIRSGPVIDGFLTDSVWALAQPAAEFTQRDPWEGQPASERTEIRVLYDQEALYFGCMYFDSRPSAIVARLMRRDDEGESDWGSIRIDTFHDHQNAYEFSFNPAGVKVDILQFDDGDREDESWDAVWDLETRIIDQGWSAEIKIPFSMLRYPSASDSSSGATWGINFIRKISRNYEQSRWAFTPKQESGFISRFGHLEGLNEIPTPRRLELLPFVVSRQQWDAGTEVRPPTASYSPQAGVDLKAGIGNNLTLDATVNPDFGQVEADPAVLNLSTFETFYPEKRPFFIEGTQIFRFATFGDGAGPGMFYSRRIGRAISEEELRVPDGGHIIDVPSSATILGAAKLSGKFENGTSLGVLQAVTRKETGIIEDSLGQRSEQILEPLSSYSMVRVKQDIFGGSYVGGILTSTAKTSRLPAITGGADWNIRLDNTTYQLNGFVAASHVSSEDGERITGSAGRLQFGRIAAVHWLWSLSGDYTTPHYDINDIGYFRRPNDFGAIGSVTYKEDVPAQLVRSYSFNANLHERRNFDGANLIRSAQLGGTFLFVNYWNLSASTQVDVGEYDDRETRGNGLYRKPTDYTGLLSISTDSREPISVDFSPKFSFDSRNKKAFGAELGVEIRPVTWMEWEVETMYERVNRQESWVENIEENGQVASIFGDRTTEELDLRVYGSVTFTRDLTLQFYTQIFLAKGHYNDFRQLQGTSEFVPYAYTGTPDFNDQSLNINLVLRWEYLPGSTLFFVWSQARLGGNDNYFTTIKDDLHDTFHIPPSNVLLLKASYWWSL